MGLNMVSNWLQALFSGHQVAKIDQSAGETNYVTNVQLSRCSWIH